jgi:hypothetical protein
MLGGVNSEPGPPPGRRRDIDTRLDAVRGRLKQLRDRDWDAVKDRAVSPGDRLEAAQQHAAEAHAAAVQVLATSADAFLRAAQAHERVAIVHEKAAKAGIGDVSQHERQADIHWAAAAGDRQRAEHAHWLLSESERAGPAAVFDEPRDGAAP